MEVAVSEFVSHTGSDPGLARDILQSANWDIHAAYNLFNDLKSGSSSIASATLSHINKEQLLPQFLPQFCRLGDALEPAEEDFRFPPTFNDSTSLNLVVGDEEEVGDPLDESPPSPSLSPNTTDQRCIDCIKADNIINNERAQTNQVSRAINIFAVSGSKG